MKKIKWQLYRYYRQVRSWLPCGWRTKNRMIRELSQNIRDFIEQNPQADIAAIKERFGTPQQIASAFVEETDMPQLLKSLRVRRRIVHIVFTAAILCLIACAIALACEVYIFHDTFGGHFEEEIRIIQ